MRHPMKQVHILFMNIRISRQRIKWSEGSHHLMTHGEGRDIFRRKCYSLFQCYALT